MSRNMHAFLRPGGITDLSEAFWKSFKRFHLILKVFDFALSSGTW